MHIRTGIPGVKCLYWIQSSLFVLALSISTVLLYKTSNAAHKILYCKSLLEHGRWSHDFEINHPHLSWNPRGCVLKSFNSEEVAACLQGNLITFIGDSSARQLFWAVAKKLDEPKAIDEYAVAERHSNLSFHGNDVQIEFYWDPFLNSTSSFFGATASYSRTIVGAGLWHARHHQNDYLNKFNENFMNMVHNTSIVSVIQNLTVLPALIPDKSRLRSDRAEPLTDARILALNKNLQYLSTEYRFDVVWSTLLMTKGYPSAYEESGIHLASRVSLAEADVILNRLCNPSSSAEMTHSTGYCCDNQTSPTTVQIACLLAASSICITWVAFLIRSIIRGKATAVAATCTPMSRINALAVFSAVCLTCYCADRTTVFQKSSKLVDPRLFLWSCGSLSIVCALGIRKCSKVLELRPVPSPSQLSILPRQQTEEWKGWMQMVILFYHYFGMSQTIWCYRLARVLVAAYFFLTGYGHATYFLHTNDYSFRRVMRVLIRLNLFTCILPFFMGTRYDAYYFPGLSSLWFMITWLTMRKTECHRIDLKRSCTRILVSIILIDVILKNSEYLETLFTCLYTMRLSLINHHEFVFRFGLDRYAPYVGMLFALLCAKYSEHQVQTHPDNVVVWTFTWLTGTVTLLSAIPILGVYFLFSTRFENKSEFNHWHSFTAPWPIIAYVALRNATPALRNTYSRPFAWLGRCSLETFVLQYHIWLAADTKGLLRLGIFDTFPVNDRVTIRNWSFWTETVIVSILFLWLSSTLEKAMSILTAWIVGPGPEDEAVMMEHKSEGSFSRSVPSWLRAWMPQGLRLRVSMLVGILWLLNVYW